jgi:hypothetical protein
LGVVEILVVNSTLDFEHVGFIVAQFCFPLYTFVSLNLVCLGPFEALEHPLQISLAFITKTLLFYSKNSP